MIVGRIDRTSMLMFISISCTTALGLTPTAISSSASWAMTSGVRSSSARNAPSTRPEPQYSSTRLVVASRSVDGGHPGVVVSLHEPGERAHGG